MGWYEDDNPDPKGPNATGITAAVDYDSLPADMDRNELQKILDEYGATAIDIKDFGISEEDLVSKTTESKVEFESIVTMETTRVDTLIAKENARIVEKLVLADTNIVCPICLDDLLPIRPLLNDTKRKNATAMPCCGKHLCESCIDRIHKLDTNFSCPCCRAPTPWKESNTRISAKLLRDANSNKPWLLHKIAAAYSMGIDGAERNHSKALEYYKKASDYGDVQSQSVLCNFYYEGGGGVEKSYAKARKWAKKAIDNGDAGASAILASILVLDKFDARQAVSDDVLEEALFLSTLAAYQGYHRGCQILADIYKYKMHQCYLRKDEKNERIFFLISMYWCGKMSEIYMDDYTYASSLRIFCGALQCHAAERWQHWIQVQPLSGYSHLPLLNWMVMKIKRTAPDLQDVPDVAKILHKWTLRCAQCGDTSEETKNKLKVCSRCKAFSYCSKECQVKHWKAGHKKDCKKHWVEEFFPNLRKPVIPHGVKYLKF